MNTILTLGLFAGIWLATIASLRVWLHRKPVTRPALAKHMQSARKVANQNRRLPHDTHG